ncbi:hypothetical protein NQZ68_013593 [Dissostichus eleginoides]|nr:hypothetical protein NQZ68_013593 [Dissostichus eleginoides]
MQEHMPTDMLSAFSHNPLHIDPLPGAAFLFGRMQQTPAFGDTAYVLSDLSPDNSICSCNFQGISDLTASTNRSRTEWKATLYTEQSLADPKLETQEEEFAPRSGFASQN